MKDVNPLKEIVDFYKVEENETWKAIQSLNIRESTVATKIEG